MPAPPIPYFWNVSDVASGALLNAQLYQALQFFLAPPRFQGYGSTNQTITSGITFTSCNLDTEIIDSENGHSTTTNNSRYVVQVPGTYLCIASAGFAANSAGNRAVRVGVNGVGAQAGQLAQGNAGANSWYGVVTAWVALAAGDYVECQVWQNSGASLVTNGGAQVGPTLTCLWYSN